MDKPVYGMNAIVELKKEHACHLSKQWRVIRLGADIRMKCLGCSATVLMPRRDFEKRIKRVIDPGEEE